MNIAKLDDLELQKMGLPWMLDTIRAECLVPGMAAAAFTSSGIHQQAVVGVRCRKKPDLIGATDRFMIGANTQAMAAALVAVLVGSGDIPLTLALEEVFADGLVKIHPALRSVTLSQLLRHKAGVAAYREAEHLPKKIKGCPRRQRLTFARMLLSQPPLLNPGTQFAYSFAGYVLAAAMLEHYLDEPWESLMRRRLFEPLNILAGFGMPAQFDVQQPLGHRLQGLWLKPDYPEKTRGLPVSLSPANGVNICLPGYIRFAQWFLKGIIKGSTALLDENTIQAFYQPDDDYLPGWHLQAYQNQRLYFHTANLENFSALILLLPGQGLGAIVLANAGDRLTDKACHLVLNKILHAFG